MGGLAPSRVWLKADGDLATGQGLSDRVLKDMIKLAVKDLADPVLKVLATVTVLLKDPDTVFDPIEAAISDPETRPEFILQGLKLIDSGAMRLGADLSKVVYGDLFMGLNSETLNTILKLVDPRDDSLKSRKTLKSSGEGLD
jgi:hypothetical protein